MVDGRASTSGCPYGRELGNVKLTKFLSTEQDIEYTISLSCYDLGSIVWACAEQLPRMEINLATYKLNADPREEDERKVPELLLDCKCNSTLMLRKQNCRLRPSSSSFSQLSNNHRPRRRYRISLPCPSAM